MYLECQQLENSVYKCVSWMGAYIFMFVNMMTLICSLFFYIFLVNKSAFNIVFFIDSDSECIIYPK